MSEKPTELTIEELVKWLHVLSKLHDPATTKTSVIHIEPVGKSQLQFHILSK